MTKFVDLLERVLVFPQSEMRLLSRANNALSEIADTIIDTDGEHQIIRSPDEFHLASLPKILVYPIGSRNQVEQICGVTIERGKFKVYWSWCSDVSIFPTVESLIAGLEDEISVH